ncbi:MAG TPA: hypothetical protein VLV50_15655 [Stellaceae bacterium]|nr:hypothetical protein [Stellaceae bacterium]
MPLRGNLMRRAFAGAAVLTLIAATLAPFPALARVHGVVGFGFNLGVPVFPPPPPIVYAPPPVYYVPPPPVVYSPPPVVYTTPAPAAAVTAPPAAPTTAANPYCREYQSTTMIDGAPQTMYGTACLQPDGTWRIVN